MNSGFGIYILLPVLYAACVMSPMFSYQNKETAGSLISQTNPQGTTLNVCFCLNLKFGNFILGSFSNDDGDGKENGT